MLASNIVLFHQILLATYMLRNTLLYHRGIQRSLLPPGRTRDACPVRPTHVKRAVYLIFSTQLHMSSRFLPIIFFLTSLSHISDS
jgi:hypothetical protein